MELSCEGPPPARYGDGSGSSRGTAACAVSGDLRRLRVISVLFPAESCGALFLANSKGKGEWGRLSEWPTTRVPSSLLTLLFRADESSQVLDCFFRARAANTLSLRLSRNIDGVDVVLCLLLKELGRLLYTLDGDESSGVTKPFCELHLSYLAFCCCTW